MIFYFSLTGTPLVIIFYCIKIYSLLYHTIKDEGIYMKKIKDDVLYLEKYCKGLT